MEQQQIRAPPIIKASTITTIFDPTAIPTSHPFTIQSQQDSEDLIDLGQESLFSGTRNGIKEQNRKGELENVELNEGPVISEVFAMFDLSSIYKYLLMLLLNVLFRNCSSH